MPDTDRGSMVKVWSWNPGGGAQCREVPIEMADEIRDELRAHGWVTWVTGSIPLRID